MEAVDLSKLSDKALAAEMVAAENSTDDDRMVLAMNEIAGRIALPLDHTEQGFTEWANEQVDAFVKRSLA